MTTEPRLPIWQPLTLCQKLLALPMASKGVATQSSTTIFHNNYEALLKDWESHVPLRFFFPDCRKCLNNYKEESVNSPKQLNSFWFSLFCLLEHYSWDSKSEAFTHHRWIHESFRVIFSLVDKWCLKISNRNIEFVCNKLRPLWI